jgi:hypothetical protein
MATGGFHHGHGQARRVLHSRSRAGARRPLETADCIITRTAGDLIISTAQIESHAPSLSSSTSRLGRSRGFSARAGGQACRVQEWISGGFDSGGQVSRTHTHANPGENQFCSRKFLPTQPQSSPEEDTDSKPLPCLRACVPA